MAEDYGSAFADDEPVRVALAPTKDGREQWVDLRRELTAGQRDAFQARQFVAKYDKKALAAGNLKADQIEIEFDMQAATGAVAPLEYWIVDWLLYDRRGEPVALSVKAISDLKPRLADMLVARTRELTATGEVEKKDSEAVPALST